MEFIVFFLQQLPLLLSMFTTMWVAVKRCPLFWKGGIVAIIALFLSFFVAVTPVAASPAFGAIDHIEQACLVQTPVLDGGVQEQVQTCPQLRKLRSGIWACQSGVNYDSIWFKPDNYFRMTCGHVEAIIKMVLMIGLTAITLDGIGIGDTMLNMGIAASPVTKRWVGTSGETLQNAKVTYWYNKRPCVLEVTLYSNKEGAAMSVLRDYARHSLDADEFAAFENAAQRRKVKNRTDGRETTVAPGGHFVCLQDVTNVSGRGCEVIHFKGDAVCRSSVVGWLKKYADKAEKYKHSTAFPVVSGEVSVVLGASIKDFLNAYGMAYTLKLISKYFRKEILQCRNNAVLLDATMVDIVEREIRDGFLMVEGPEELLKDVFKDVRYGGGIRIFTNEALIKGRMRLKVNESLDRLVIHSDPRNNKGTLARKIDDGQILVTYWSYAQVAKAASSGPQLLAQFEELNGYDCENGYVHQLDVDESGTAWARNFSQVSEQDALASGARFYNALYHGAMDDGMLPTEGQTDEAAMTTPKIAKRDNLINRLIMLGLPVATAATLMFLMGSFIKNWCISKRAFETAADKWKITLPWSISGIVMAHSAREELGNVNWKVHNNNLVYWCPVYKELIVHDSLYKNAHPMNDMGDEDGDMMFAWLIVINGVQQVLLSRHPIGIGGFQFIDPNKVNVPWKFTCYKKTDGTVVDIDVMHLTPIKTAEDYTFASLEEVEDADEPTTKDYSHEEWEALLEYEEGKREYAVALGKAVNTGTFRIGHNMEVNPVELQLIADASQNGAVNLETMKRLNAAVQGMAEAKFDDMIAGDLAMGTKYKALKKMADQGIKVLKGSYTLLIQKSVKTYCVVQQYLAKTVETNGQAMRNAEKLKKLCEERGLTPDMVEGRELINKIGHGLHDFSFKGNPAIKEEILTLEGFTTAKAAEVAYGAYLHLHENGLRDNSIFLFADDYVEGASEDCIFGYLVKYLETSEPTDNGPEGPNPEGDGPEDDDEWMLLEMAAEDATNCGTSEEPSDRTDEILFDAYHLPTREQMRSMKQSHIREYCQINPLITKWSKFDRVALREELIQRIVECILDDYYNNNDDNDSVVEQICRDAREKAELLSAAQLRDFIQQRKEDLSETGFKAAMNCSSKEELIQFVVDGCLHVWDTEDIPAPPNGGGDRGHETEAEASMRMIEAMMPQIEVERAEHEAQKDVKEKLHVVSMRQEKRIADRLQREGHFAYYIGRQMVIGNEKFPGSQLANKFKDGTKEENIANFERWFVENKDGHLKQILSWIVKQSVQAMNQGKQAYLVCWCAPEKCHGDVLKEYISLEIAKEIVRADKKEKEAQMSKATKAAIEEWAENGKAVQLKQAKNGKYFFVVDGTTKWIPKSLLSEEDSKDRNKVRSVYEQGKKMFNQGVVGTLFKSLGLAGLLFAALLGMEEGLMAMVYNVVVWNQEEDGLHPWIQWKQWMNTARLDLIKRDRMEIDKSEKELYKLRNQLDDLNLKIANGEATPKDEERKDLIEETIWHYECVIRDIGNPLDIGKSREPKDRPLDIVKNRRCSGAMKCGTNRIKKTRGKNKGKGYWVTHPGCRPDEPCKRACGGNYMQENELIIRKGERVTLWYTPVKLSQVESYWGNKVVRRDV